MLHIYYGQKHLYIQHMKTHVTHSPVWQFRNLNNHYPDTTIQILSIYGKSQPKTKLKHAAQNNKLAALSSSEI